MADLMGAKGVLLDRILLYRRRLAPYDPYDLMRSLMPGRIIGLKKRRSYTYTGHELLPRIMSTEYTLVH